MRPPLPNEVEVSVFGPGLGESIVVHMGDDEWMIIDSCMDRIAKRPAALAYLEKIGVDYSKRVRAIVATHWDSDHIGGLADVVTACPAASFWCTAAVQRDELLALINLGKKRSQLKTRRFREITLIRKLLEERHGEELGTPRLAMESVNIEDWSPGSAATARSVHAVSPSSRSLLVAADNLSRVLADGTQLARRIQQLSRNDASVALRVDFGPFSALLGGDLEHSSDGGCGWPGVVAYIGKRWGRSSLFKVPHHGSSDSHNDAVWTELLEAQPAAALTCFISGERLPTDDDAHRIRGLTPHAYLCRPANDGPKPQYGPEETTLAEMEPLESSISGVHWRRSLKDDKGWHVELSGAAAAL